MDQMQQDSTTTATSGTPTPAIIAAQTKRAYQAAAGPLATKDLLNRPWFRENKLGGPTVGRAISALVRAHEIHKVREGVYAKGAGPQRATGTPATSARGNGMQATSKYRVPPKKAGSQSKSQAKRIAAGRRPIGVAQRQQSQQFSASPLGPTGQKLGTTTQHMSGSQTGQGAMIQRIQALEASNRMLAQQVDRLLNDMYGQQPR